MNQEYSLVCPLCRHSQFYIKYEASHVYSYIVDTDAPGSKNKDEFLSFLYDDRKLIKSDQYAECRACGAKFPCSFNVWDKENSLQELQSVINNYNK